MEFVDLYRALQELTKQLLEFWKNQKLNHTRDQVSLKSVLMLKISYKIRSLE